MVRRILNGRNRRSGYTLIELVIVMAIISVLLAVAVPIYTKSIQRTKETLLKQNLFTLRNVIDEYTFDKKAAPQSLNDLVREGYLRAVPIDPITGNEKSWRLIIEDALTSVDQTQPRHLRRAQRLGSEEPRRHGLLRVVTPTYNQGSTTSPIGRSPATPGSASVIIASGCPSINPSSSWFNRSAAVMNSPCGSSPYSERTAFGRIFAANFADFSIGTVASLVPWNRATPGCR